MVTLLFAPQPLAYVRRLLTRVAAYGADSEPRTSESGCEITYDVLFRPVQLFPRAKFFPSPRFGEDAMTKRARVVAAFVSVVNFASIRKPRASRSKATITNLTTDNIHFTMDSSDRVLQTPRPETAL